MLQSFAWFGSNLAAKQRISRWLIAFAKCCMVHLRDVHCHDLRAELVNVLLPHELETLLQSGNRPSFCIQVGGDAGIWLDMSLIDHNRNVDYMYTSTLQRSTTAFGTLLFGCVGVHPQL